jgi:hypothetical protein
MIDGQELEHAARRAEAAQPAVDAWRLRQGEGLYAGLPYDDPVGLLELAANSARDVPDLAAEVRRLSPAEYWVGREECREGECDWFFDEDGNQIRPLGGPCEHIEVRVATFGDVKRAEHLDALAKALKRAAEVAQRGGGIDDRDMARIVIETVDEVYEQMRAEEVAG